MDKMDDNLVELHKQYLQDAPRYYQIENVVINIWDTWHSNLENPLLLQGTILQPRPIRLTMMGNNPMLDLGITYFVLFELFPYLELLYQMALRMNQQGYQVDAYKENNKNKYPSQYSPINFMDYSLQSILHAFTLPISWKHRIKKKIDLKQEKRDFKVNNYEMFNQIDERYVGDEDKLYSSYNIALFTRHHYREILHALIVTLG